MTSLNQKWLKRKEDYENILAKAVKLRNKINDPLDDFGQRELELIIFSLQDSIDSLDKTLRQIDYDK